MRRMPRWLALPLVAPLLASAQPQTAIVLAGDLGWNGVGYHGSDRNVPHVDPLAQHGLELQRFCASQ